MTSHISLPHPNDSDAPARTARERYVAEARHALDAHSDLLTPLERLALLRDLALLDELDNIGFQLWRVAEAVDPTPDEDEQEEE